MKKYLENAIILLSLRLEEKMYVLWKVWIKCYFMDS